MTNKQELDYLKANLKILIEKWDTYSHYSANFDYDAGFETGVNSCAEQLEELLNRIEEMKLW